MQLSLLKTSQSADRPVMQLILLISSQQNPQLSVVMFTVQSVLKLLQKMVQSPRLPVMSLLLLLLLKLSMSKAMSLQLKVRLLSVMSV